MPASLDHPKQHLEAGLQLLGATSPRTARARWDTRWVIEGGGVGTLEGSDHGAVLLSGSLPPDSADPSARWTWRQGGLPVATNDDGRRTGCSRSARPRGGRLAREDTEDVRLMSPSLPGPDPGPAPPANDG